MADITIAEFRTKFPEFTESLVRDRDVGRWLETAYQLSDVAREATFFTAAHLIALDLAERTAGAIAPADERGGVILEESFGPKKLKFMQQAMDGREVWYTRTAYGRLALMLEQRAPAGVISVRNV